VRACARARARVCVEKQSLRVCIGTSFTQVSLPKSYFYGSRTQLWMYEIYRWSRMKYMDEYCCGNDRVYLSLIFIPNFYFQNLIFIPVPLLCAKFKARNVGRMWSYKMTRMGNRTSGTH